MLFAIVICASVSYYGYSTLNRQIFHEKRPNEVNDLYPDLKFKDMKT